jgi:hypothetical protein
VHLPRKAIGLLLQRRRTLGAGLSQSLRQLLLRGLNATAQRLVRCRALSLRVALCLCQLRGGLCALLVQLFLEGLGAPGQQLVGVAAQAGHVLGVAGLQSRALLLQASLDGFDALVRRLVRLCKRMSGHS